MKYFVLGAIASGTLLYGISLLYGITGTLAARHARRALRAARRRSACRRCSRSRSSSSGVAFKFGAVPFHMWLPDVYQGAPAPVTLYIGSAPEDRARSRSSGACSSKGSGRCTTRAGRTC